MSPFVFLTPGQLEFLKTNHSLQENLIIKLRECKVSYHIFKVLVNMSLKIFKPLVNLSFVLFAFYFAEVVNLNFKRWSTLHYYF